MKSPVQRHSMVMVLREIPPQSADSLRRGGDRRL